MKDLESARALAEGYLAAPLPRRWSHVQCVAQRAEKIRPHLDGGSTLVATSWLHDVGYAPDLNRTRFHPLDGARALRSWEVDPTICGLVAFHSAASHEARVLGLIRELSTFPDPRGVLRDLLWYLDMTTGPDGQTVSFEHRMAEVRDRYPSDHYVIRALDGSMSDRRSAVERAESWLAGAGLAGQV